MRHAGDQEPNFLSPNVQRGDYGFLNLFPEDTRGVDRSLWRLSGLRWVFGCHGKLFNLFLGSVFS
jgi:hypothetical protein